MEKLEKENKPTTGVKKTSILQKTKTTITSKTATTQISTSAVKNPSNALKKSVTKTIDPKTK